MRTAIIVWSVLLAGCTPAMQRSFFTVRPTPVPVLAREAILQAAELGELMAQFREMGVKLQQGRVLPIEASAAITRSEIEYAQAQTRATTALGLATTPLQVQAALAPLIGAASTATALLRPVAGLRDLQGGPGVITRQLPPMLTRAEGLMRDLGRIE